MTHANGIKLSGKGLLTSETASRQPFWRVLKPGSPAPMPAAGAKGAGRTSRLLGLQGLDPPADGVDDPLGRGCPGGDAERLRREQGQFKKAREVYLAGFGEHETYSVCCHAACPRERCRVRRPRHRP